MEDGETVTPRVVRLSTGLHCEESARLSSYRA
jgi:hypothetical protein